MFMSNKALLDQLMGADRNESSFKGLREQWKDDSMCKPYLMDFCPYEIFYNTKMFLGNCSKTHSDVVRSQFEASDDPEKVASVRKYEFDLLAHLERIVDTVERKVARQKERINATVPEFRISETKEAEIAGLNHQVSVSIKEVERLAESGQFEESTILMGKVTELQNRIKELSEDKFAKYVKKEVVCEVCGVLIGAGVDEEGRPERAHDHVRGKQHMGMERVRLKVIELKTKHKIRKSRRDTEFVPSVELTKELEREGFEVVLPDTVENEAGEEFQHEPPKDRTYSRHRRRSRSRSPAKDDERSSRKSRSRSISPISFSEDEFGRKRRKPRDFPRRDRNSHQRWSRRSPPRQPRARSRSRSMASIGSPKSMASISLE